MRVIVAEDSGLYRDMLVRTLAGGGLEVVGEAASADEAVALVDADPPELVVLDIRMPPTWTDDGLRAALRIRDRHPKVAVVLLSQYGEVEYAAQVAGALGERAGYLLKERVAGAGELLQAIERVAAGGLVVDPEVVARLLRRPRAGDPLRALTARELEVLALMAEGRSNAAIARRLRIAVGTVEKHATAVFRKLALAPDEDRQLAGGNARVHAVLAYLRSTGKLAS